MIEAIPAADIMTTEKTTISRRVSRMLGLDLDAWNLLMVVSLVLGAIAAFASFQLSP
jgi:hypothetical protein